MKWLLPAALLAAVVVVFTRRQSQGVDAADWLDPLWGDAGAPPPWLDAPALAPAPAADAFTWPSMPDWGALPDFTPPDFTWPSMPEWASNAAQSVSDTVTQAASAASRAVAKIIATGPGWNTVQLDDGSTVRQQGARNWRNNNPGNIEDGPFARAHGAIGSDGRFAIFPSYEVGRAAKSALIFDSANYRNLLLSAAIARYAPPTENDTTGYQRTVLGAVGFSDRAMHTYSAMERAAILDAMERQEGFKVGSVTVIEQPGATA